MITKQQLVQLSKTISHALRHAPEQYGLQLDNEGWVLVSDLLQALKKLKPSYENLTTEDIAYVVSNNSKKRHEIKTDKIRAYYGHSVKQDFSREIKEPPEFLYHGTSPELIETIKREGLKPMNRQHVHLSLTIKTAKLVALRKTNKPAIFKVFAKQAYDSGVNFYFANEDIWLADPIEEKFLTLQEGDS
jgi:putative RNA 2'-phosphotransferase